MSPLTLLAIFAHPDDEVGVGSTLARYSDAGHRVVLACATRGEVATIFCDDCATPENLAEVRTHELECACGHLGIGDLRWLDWPDGGVKDLPRPAAVGQVVALIRAVQPDVILTHPENGLYPHPDHLAVWEIVRAAFAAAADADEYPAAGAAWAASRLFTRAMPQSILERAPALKEFRVELNGQLLPFLGVPDEQIDVWMRVAPWVERRMAAWACHQSQHNPRGFSTTMPDGLRREMAENEPFLLVAARIPLPEGVNDDLLAGLQRAEPAPVAPAAQVAALKAALAEQRAYLQLCEDAGRDAAAEPRFQELTRGLAESQQGAIALLARSLRRFGETASGIRPATPVLAEGVRQRGMAAKVRFFAAGAQKSLALCQAQMAAVPVDADLWRELAEQIQAQLAALAAFKG